ncbi:alanine--tRNA ligase-related protein, partial [Staphylococcus epidermidis]|uniref:alanine--tRNA ligase-related protein n=1 Tax=Staphylococcus epidermidis TaxID=1282 RepID=UPI0034D98135
MIQPSPPLLPIHDHSLFSINSPLPTFKKYFHPPQTPKKPTILNSQKPIPTNHIQNLPFTPPHHTFFHILPNFSIPDYFKHQPIQFPSQFLTTH